MQRGLPSAVIAWLFSLGMPRMCHVVPSITSPSVNLSSMSGKDDHFKELKFKGIRCFAIDLTQDDLIWRPYSIDFESEVYWHNNSQNEVSQFSLLNRDPPSVAFLLSNRDIKEC